MLAFQRLRNAAAVLQGPVHVHSGKLRRDRHSHPGEAERYADPADQREAYPGQERRKRSVTIQLLAIFIVLYEKF